MEQNSDYYDDVYIKGSYDKDPNELPWYPLWRVIVDYIKKHNVGRVIDLGCGPGHLAQLLYSEVMGLSYSGWDFSKEAINKARERCPYEGYDFMTGDLRLLDFSSEMNSGFKSVFVCSEVLEHIEDDLGLLKRLPNNSTVLLTVPNFDDPGHVRKFAKAKKVRDRYSKILDTIDVFRLSTRKHFFLSGVRNHSIDSGLRIR